MKKFKSFLSESISVSEAVSANAQIKDVVSAGLTAVVSTHMFHWKTLNEATHEAIGEFYSGLEEAVDGLVEASIGVGVDIRDNLEFSAMFSMAELNRETAIQIIVELRDRVNVALAATQSPAVQSLNDHLIDIQRLIDRVLYRLDLS